MKPVKLSSKIFYLPFQGGTSFVDHLCYFCLVFVMLSHLFIAALWSPAGEALVYNVCVYVTFPCGILGQVWYLIVSIPDLCPFLLFNNNYKLCEVCFNYTTDTQS